MRELLRRQPHRVVHEPPELPRRRAEPRGGPRHRPPSRGRQPLEGAVAHAAIIVDVVDGVGVVRGGGAEQRGHPLGAELHRHHLAPRLERERARRAHGAEDDETRLRRTPVGVAPAGESEARRVVGEHAMRGRRVAVRDVARDVVRDVRPRALQDADERRRGRGRRELHVAADAGARGGERHPLHLRCGRRARNARVPRSTPLSRPGAAECAAG